MVKRWSGISLVATTVLAVLLLASSSGAVPIGPDCGTCQGSIYDLFYDTSPIATTATTQTFQITLTIDTSGYSGTGVKIDTVALKVSSSFVSADLITAPGGVDNWVEMIGGLSAAGCSGSGSGYECVRVAAVKAPLVHPANPEDALYTWVFNIELPTGTLFTGTDQSSIKARYVTNSGFKSGALVSENITLSALNSPSSVSTPEPGAVAVFSIGLLVAGGMIARLRKD